MVGACSAAAPSGSGVPGPATSAGASLASPEAPSPHWEPHTAWERAVVDVAADGEYSQEAALRLFATAYGPLPGVDVQQDLHGVEDRTLAIDAVARYRDALTSEQRAAIDAYLAPPPGAIEVDVPPVAQLPRIRLVKALATGLQDAIREVAEEARMDIAAKIGDHDGFMKIYFEPRPADVPAIEGIYPNGGTVAAYVAGAFVGCTITIYDEATTQSGLQLTALMTHEVMHCFQAAAHKTQAVHDNAPKWINEGMATWVGMALGGPSPNYERFWDLYLLFPQRPLTARAYDAVGFYSHLQESGIDPWSVLRPMLDAGTNSLAAYKASGAEAESFVDTWASSVLRDGTAGPAWNTTGPGIPSTAYKPGVAILANGTDLALAQPFFTNSVMRYQVDSDIVQVEVDGHARLRDSTLDVAVHGTAMFCVAGHDCSSNCPGSEPGDYPTLDPSFYLAPSGGDEGLVGHLRGVKASDVACSPPPTAEPTDGDFCRRYRDYVAWITALGPDADMTPELAAQIAHRFDDMYPVAPAQLKDDVALVWTIYATFANISEPMNVPAAGQVGGIANLPDALMAMHAYCGIPWPTS